MNTKEQRDTIADGKWWRDWGKQFGWRLYGWTYRSGATFFREGAYQPSVEISGDMRQDIDNAMQALKEKT